MAADPSHVGRYRVEQRLGTLGADVLFAGLDSRLLRPVTLQVAFGHGEDFVRAVAEHRTAAMAVQRLSHPGILRVHELGEAKGASFLAMETAGRPLAALLAAGGALQPARAGAIVGQLLDALALAHGLGVIHRNVHAGCVLLAEGERAKLAGFDLARIRGLEAAFDPQARGRMSGKVAALAPEQIAGGELDERVDIFKAGMLLYRLLSGRAPFEGSGAWSIAKATLRDEPRPLSQANPSVTRELENVVSVALAKDPARRFPSAQAFARTLRAALA